MVCGRDVDVHLSAQRRRGCAAELPRVVPWPEVIARGYAMPLSPPKLDSKEEHFRIARSAGNGESSSVSRAS
jgi:hypothetical protein